MKEKINSGPRFKLNVIKFAREPYKKLIRKPLLTIGFYVTVIPLATWMLYPKFILSLAMAIVLISLATILVGINAQTLKYFANRKVNGYCFLFRCNRIEKKRNRFTQNTKNKIVFNKKLAMN